MAERARGQSTPQRIKVGIQPPDLSPYKAGNTGIDYVATLDSGREGPHVMVNALTHGNELCGAVVVQALLAARPQPLRGKLTLSFSNVDDFLRFNDQAPYSSRYVDEDFNRLWDLETLEGCRQSRELLRARVFWPLLEEVDFLLDLHSMSDASAPMVLTGLQKKSRRLAEAMGYPVYVVMDKGHQAGRRMRDYGAFDDPARPQTALLVECGQHWEPASVAVAHAATLYFLRQFNILPDSFLAAHLPSQPRAPQRVIAVSEAVTASEKGFRFVQPFRGYECIPRAGTVIGYNGGEAVLTPYDDCVLVMPIISEHARGGQTAVRLGRFVS